MLLRVLFASVTTLGGFIGAEAPLPEVVLAVGEESTTLQDMREWLVSNHLLEDGLSDHQIERRYRVFSSMEFGEFAHKPKSDLMNDVLPIEGNCAAY